MFSPLNYPSIQSPATILHSCFPLQGCGGGGGLGWGGGGGGAPASSSGFLKYCHQPLIITDPCTHQHAPKHLSLTMLPTSPPSHHFSHYHHQHNPTYSNLLHHQTYSLHLTGGGGWGVGWGVGGGGVLALSAPHFPSSSHQFPHCLTTKLDCHLALTCLVLTHASPS